MKTHLPYVMTLLLALPLAAGAQDEAPEVSSVQRTINAAGEVQLPAATPEVSKGQQWKFQILNEIYFNEAEYREHQGDTTVTTYTEPKLGYLLAPQTYLELSVPFEINSVPRADQRARNIHEEAQQGKIFEGTRSANVWLGLNHKGGQVWGSQQMVTWLRYYLPTSELAQTKKQNGIVRLDLQVPWTLGSWQLVYLLNPRLTLSHDEAISRQSTLSFRQYLYVNYSVTDSLIVYTSYGHKLLSYSQRILDNEQVVHSFDSGVTYVFTPKVNVTLYVINDFVEGQENIELFKPEKNNFTLATVIGF